VQYSSYHFNMYDIISQITIGSIDFDVLLKSNYWGGKDKILHHGPIISRDECYLKIHQMKLFY